MMLSFALLVIICMGLIMVANLNKALKELDNEAKQ